MTEGLYLIEGPNLIGEAPAADIEYIVISEERQSDYGEYLSEDLAGLSDGRAAVSTHCADGDKPGDRRCRKEAQLVREQLSKLCGPGKNLVIWTGSRIRATSEPSFGQPKERAIPPLSR